MLRVSKLFKMQRRSPTEIITLMLNSLGFGPNSSCSSDEYEVMQWIPQSPAGGSIYMDFTISAKKHLCGYHKPLFPIGHALAFQLIWI